MAGATEAAEGSPLSASQFVEGSANKRELYTVHRGGHKYESETVRPNVRFAKWAVEHKGTAPKKSATGGRPSRTVQFDPESRGYKRVSQNTRAPAQRPHP
jgi:hypothetical protein